MTYWKKLTDAGCKHLAGLDHLRALAIILVFLCHYRAYERPVWVDKVGLFGWSGVDLFFVLSGYLIGDQLFRQLKRVQAIDFGNFYLSRAMRIFPVYYVVVALYFLFPVLRERDGIAPLWQFLTFTQNFDLDFGTEGTFSHAWSLAIEEQFYLMLPFILYLIFKKQAQSWGPYIFFGVFAAGILLRWLNWIHFMEPYYSNQITDGRFVTYNKWIYYPVYNRLDGLLAGVGIAALMNYRPRMVARLTAYGNQLFIIGLLLLTGAYFFMRPDRLDFWPTVLGYPLLSLAYGFMVLAVLFPSCFLHRLRWKGSTLIAALSYSIYLSHKMLNEGMQGPLDAFGLPADSNWRVFFCALVAILGALLLNRVVEYPFLQWRERIRTRISSRRQDGF